jgi:hypothetical protein
MPSLTDLKLTLLATSSVPADLTALLAAVSHASKLRSLVLLSGVGATEVTAEALAALAPSTPPRSSAGGGTRSLRKLRLVGNFTLKSAPSSTAARAEVEAAEAAWEPLRRLPLEELKLHHLGHRKLPVAISSLPPGLKTLEGKMLHLVGGGQDVLDSSIYNKPDAAALAAPATGQPVVPPAPLQLRCLHLHQCQVDDITQLASCSLHFVTMALSSWPGGLPAAAAAWPELRRLVMWCPGNSGSSSSSSSSSSSCSGGRRNKGHSGHSNAAPAAAARAASAAVQSMALMQQLPGFHQLQQLELQHLPCLTAGCLSVACSTQLPALQHLKISAALVSSTEQELVAAVEASAALTGITHGTADSCLAPGGLKTLSLHLPGQLAPSLVRHHQYLQQQEQQLLLPQQPPAGASYPPGGAAGSADDGSGVEHCTPHVIMVDAPALQASLQQLVPSGLVRVISDQAGVLY